MKTWMSLFLIALTLCFVACTPKASTMDDGIPGRVSNENDEDQITIPNFSILANPERLSSEQDIQITVHNDGRFANKPVMILFHNCENANGQMQGGLGLQSDNIVIPEKGREVFDVTVSAEQQVERGEYSCEFFATTPDGYSVSKRSTFEVK